MVVTKDKNFVVEVNDGIYLTELLNGFRFSDDIKKASLYKHRHEAYDRAKKCGGTIKRYVITHEVLSCNS